MSGKVQEMAGRVKEAAGAIMDDDQMRREGKFDQAAGNIKQVAEKVVDKVSNAAKKLNKDDCSDCH
jgi:uncharacterized protein YjbJ (UPF0337 family)